MTLVALKIYVLCFISLVQNKQAHLLMLKSLLPIFLVTMLNAWTHLGPQHAETQLNSYSDIIALSEKQELLANIQGKRQGKSILIRPYKQFCPEVIF